jgi:hypothetical protein
VPRSSRITRLLSLCAVLAWAAVAGGCAGGRPNAVFYDPNGQTVASGRLDLPRLEVAGDAFKGQWTLGALTDDQLRGAFATGPYQGGRRGRDDFFLMLNPNQVDDSITLTGHVNADGTFTGWWGHNTFTGLERSGTFDVKPR